MDHVTVLPFPPLFSEGWGCLWCPITAGAGPPQNSPKIDSKNVKAVRPARNFVRANPAHSQTAQPCVPGSQWSDRPGKAKPEMDLAHRVLRCGQTLLTAGLLRCSFERTSERGSTGPVLVGRAWSGSVLGRGRHGWVTARGAPTPQGPVGRGRAMSHGLAHRHLSPKGSDHQGRTGTRGVVSRRYLGFASPSHCGTLVLGPGLGLGLG